MDNYYDVGPEEPAKGYFIPDQAYYAENLPEDRDERLTIGLYYANGSCSGEFGISWQNNVPQLESYPDTAEVLSSMPEIHASLASMTKEATTRPQIIRVLQNAGFRDLTPYKDKQSDQAQAFQKLAGARDPSNDKER